MKVSSDELRLIISALGYAIAANERLPNVAAAEEYRWLRKKLEDKAS